MFEYDAPENLLKDKIILVTGAGSGIGRAAARAFARHGATVILSGKTVSKLEAVYDEIENDGSPQPAIVPLDLAGAGEDAYVEVANGIASEFGRLDGLLHNAGLLGNLTPIQTYSLETWNKVIQVNLTAAFTLTKNLLPLLMEAPTASIVFTSSGVGRKVRAYWGAYSIAKLATDGLVELLSQELEATSNIRVNSINPGATATAMRKQAFPAEDQSTLAQPEDIMPLYLYLMGDDSKEENGELLDAQ